MAKGAPVAGGRMAERAIKRSDSRRAMTWPTGPWSGLSRCRAVFPRAHADEERIGARGRPLPGARQRACPMRSRRQPPPVWGPWPVGRHGPVASLGSIGFSPVMRLAGLPLSQVAGDRRDLCRASYGGPSTFLCRHRSPVSADPAVRRLSLGSNSAALPKLVGPVLGCARGGYQAAGLQATCYVTERAHWDVERGGYLTRGRGTVSRQVLAHAPVACR